MASRIASAYALALRSDRTRAFWTTYPIESASKAALFLQAECIPDDQLAALLREQLGGATA